MRAIVIESFGGPEKLELVDLPTPTPEPGEVLIRIAAAGVNPVDWRVRDGSLAHLFPHGFPLVSGWDAAGTIAALGDGVSGFAIGDRVMAYCRKPVIQWGCYADYVTMPADKVVAVPAPLSLTEAAALPLCALTAWQALVKFANLARGQSVLIHAGAGGVGSLALQFARHAGARVATTARAANHDYVRSLGADLAIDYTAADVAAAVRDWAPGGVDVVLDGAGGKALADSYGLVRSGGTLVSVVNQVDKDKIAALGLRGSFIFARSDGVQLAEIAKLFDAGVIHPPAITTMPLERAAEAQEINRAGHVRGKIVLTL